MKDLEFNKIAAAILLAGVIAMISAFITDILYKPDHNAKRGYEVALAESGSDNKKAEDEVVDIAVLLSNADADAGKKLLKKCAACHSFDQGGKHKVGPNLWGIADSKIASKSGYAYSNALSSIDKKWNDEEIYAFLKAPKKYAKGTKMSFAGFKKPQDVANLIKYLKTLK